MIKAHPKICAIGSRYIKDIFNGDIVVEEKLDGSQFAFAKMGGRMVYRSKGKVFGDDPEKMFMPAVEYLERIKDRISSWDIVFYCEYLRTPKHNTIKYDRIPFNHLALFGVSDRGGTNWFDERRYLEYWAKVLEIEPIKLIHSGPGSEVSPLMLDEFLNYPSVLGGSKIEGVVLKNYHLPCIIGDQIIPFMAGKYVSEQFKEVHRERWGSQETKKGKMELFLEGLSTPARFQKAIQHLADKSELEYDPRDIPNLIAEIRRDVLDEELPYLKDSLFKIFERDITRACVRGAPEHYKKFLMEMEEVNGLH